MPAGIVGLGRRVHAPAQSIRLHDKQRRTKRSKRLRKMGGIAELRSDEGEGE